MKKTKKKILITGFFGVNNLGDDIMLKCFCDKLCKAYPDIDVTLLFLYGSCQNIKLPSQIKILKLNRLKYGKKYIMKYILSNRYDALFWIGGTCFTDKAGDGLYSYMKIFNEKRKIFGYVGVGIGDIYDLTRKSKTDFLIKNASFITLRDSKSYEKALEIRDKNDLYLCEDLVYLMEDKNNYNGVRLRTLVISWREFSLYYNFSIENNAINVLCEFIGNIHKDFDNIIVMPIGDRVDDEVNDKIYKKMMRKEYSYKVQYYNIDNVENKVKIIKSANLFISGRLHGIFMSEIANVNTIAIGYDNKIQRFLKSIKKEEDLIYPDEFSTEKLMEIYNIKNQVDEQIIHDSYMKSELNISHFIEFIKRKEIGYE